MRNNNRDEFVARLLESARLEVLPTPTIEDKVLESVDVGRSVTVTASPAQGLQPTVELAVRLAQQGYRAVPHLAARMLSGRSELAETVSRLHEAGVRGVFVPGGDQEPPVGEYTCALDVLRDLDTLPNPGMEVGIAGYPETHPRINDDVTVQAMWDKRRYAAHVVSNLTFDPVQVQLWVQRLRARNVDLPVLIGVPGPIERGTLLTMATKIGVGDSTRFLRSHKSVMARLFAPGGFTGERFLQECATGLHDARAGVNGLHLYTFNQVAATETWRRTYLQRLYAARVGQ